MTHYGRWIALCIFFIFLFFTLTNILSSLSFIYQYFLLATNIFQNPWYSHRSSVSSLGCVWITSRNSPCTVMVRQTQLYPTSMWFWLWDKCCGPCQEFSCSMKFTESGQPCNNWPCCDKVEVAMVAVAMVAVAMVAVAMVAVAMVAVATWAQKILEKIFYTILQNIVFMKMMMVPSPNYLECNLIFTPLFQFYIQVSHLMYHMIHF